MEGDIPYEDHVNNPDFSSEEEIEVEHIVDERMVGTERQLLPKWKGFELDPNAWEPASVFDNNEALKVIIRQELCPYLAILSFLHASLW